jgi:glycosyltransferase involved in cell wall biosynthesis
MAKKKSKRVKALPFVSICTPTFNRRPFIPYMIKCFNHQTYPKDKIEWIIIDDGTDKIEDLISHIPQVKYFKYDTKLTLGNKRNIMHAKSKGDILVYMDDDDYYPPERVSHAVEMLQSHPTALCGGSSIMHIYFKHINQMFRFGPYGDKHATAATFAFKRELLNHTSYQEEACLAEEKHFLKDYTIPFVQFDTMKTILVFSHDHNSFDKKELLKQGSNNPFIKASSVTPADFVKDNDFLDFYLRDIDDLLKNYRPGDPSNKKDVLKQIDEMKQKREELMKHRLEHDNIINKINRTETLLKNEHINQVSNMALVIQELTLENSNLKDKIQYMETRLKQLIATKIDEKLRDVT